MIHTHTLGRTPLDKGSAHRRDIIACLRIHFQNVGTSNIHIWYWYTGWCKILLALVLKMLSVVVRPFFHPRVSWCLFYLLLWGNGCNDIHWISEYWIMLSYMSNRGLRLNVAKSVCFTVYSSCSKIRRFRTEWKLVRIEIVLKFCQRIVFESQKWKTESGVKDMHFVVSQSTAAVMGFPGTWGFAVRSGCRVQRHDMYYVEYMWTFVDKPLLGACVYRGNIFDLLYNVTINLVYHNLVCHVEWQTLTCWHRAPAMNRTRNYV